MQITDRTFNDHRPAERPLMSGPDDNWARRLFSKEIQLLRGLFEFCRQTVSGGRFLRRFGRFRRFRSRPDRAHAGRAEAMNGGGKLA